MSLKKIKQLITALNESSIDFPQQSPPKEVWSFSAEDYKLRPEVRNKIIDALSEYPESDLLGLAEDIHIVGSITSNTYDDSSDIDIHIIPKEGKVPKKEELSFTKKVMKWYKDNRDEKDWYVGKYPFEVFIQFDNASDMESVGVYSVKRNKWLKKPTLQNKNYNPYEIFKDVFSDIKSILDKTDTTIMDLRRDVLDYKFLSTALSRAPKLAQKQILRALKQKLSSMEKDIESLASDKEVWKQSRRLYRAGTKNWDNKNAQYKMIARYLYGKLVSNLEDLIEDKELSDNEVVEVEKALQKFMSF